MDWRVTVSRLTTRLSVSARRLRGRMRANARAGSAALEFALIAPVFFLLMFAIIETSILYFAQATLQYAVNDAARYVRTGQAAGASMTQAQFRTRVCNNIAPLLACGSNLQIDMESYSNFGGASFTNPLNANNTLNSSLTNYQMGSACSVVLVRAFYTWPVLTPLLTPFLADMAGNDHLIYAAAAFRNEPYSTGMSGC
jgi:Flp pilus assembly protein TadG